jgi:hypothetical protein
MWGKSGVQCLDCKAEWNYTWTAKNRKDLVVCPNCTSLEVAVLDQTVPFKFGDGRWPEFLYHCVCGAIFQSPPKTTPDPFETNLEALKAKEITCLICGRSNKNKWYLPPEVQ